MSDVKQNPGHLDIYSWAAAVAKDNKIDVGQIAVASQAAGSKKGGREGKEERRRNGNETD